MGNLRLAEPAEESGAGAPALPLTDEARARGNPRARSSRRVRRIAETLQSLEIYAALIRARGPQSVRQLMDTTAIADGTLYPVLQKRVAVGLLDDGSREGVSVYDLTPKGYRHAREALHRLEIDSATWLRAERTYAD